jgi:hypothetical protein
MVATRRRAAARVLAPLLAGAAALSLLAATSGPSVAVSCASKVSLQRTKHQVFADKVVLDTFRATVTTAGRSRTAIVIRMTLPRGSKPKLIHQPLGLVKPISQQVKAQAPKALAAVNGDFFAYYRMSHGSVLLPWSSSVAHGQLVRASSASHMVVGVDRTGHPYGGPLSVTGTVEDGSVSYPITGVDSDSIASDGVAVFTRAWYPSGSTPRPTGDTEWVVSKGVLTAVLTGHGNGSPVPPKSKVVAFGRSLAAQAAKAKVGDPVTVTYHQVTTTGAALGEAVGSGPALVKSGQVVLDCAHYDSEPRPRTTIGWTSKGRWRTLVVPGTGYDPTGYRIGGFDVPEEAAVVSHLGFDNAFILDGGGSVTEWTRHGRRWTRVDDSNSAWERYVPNGLAFSRP